MNCEQVFEQLSALLDGELNAEERAQLQAHLDGCPRCRALLEELRQTDAAMADLRQPPPADFAQGVLDRIGQNAARTKQKKRFRLAGTCAAAAAVLGLVIGVGLRNLLREQPSGAPSVKAGEFAEADSAMPAAEAPQTATMAAGSHLGETFAAQDISGGESLVLYGVTAPELTEQELVWRQADVADPWTFLEELGQQTAPAAEKSGSLYTVCCYQVEPGVLDTLAAANHAQIAAGYSGEETGGASGASDGEDTSAPENGEDAATVYLILPQEEN